MTQLTDNTWYTSDYISPLQLFIRLTRGQLQPGKFWRKASFRRKFLIRSLVMPRATSQLLTNLTQWPELNTLLARQPRLPIRLHRPYMAVNIKRDFALDALCFHYQQMRQLLSREQQVSYLSQYGLNLAKFETKTGELFQLDLVSLVSLDKEGESTIVVRDAQLRILALPCVALTNNAHYLSADYRARQTTSLTKLSSRRPKPAMVFFPNAS